MARKNCAQGAHRRNRQFSLEALERRELMAADLAVDPLADAPLQTDPPPVQHAIAADGLTGMPGQFHLLAGDSIPSPVAAALARAFDGSGNNVANPEWGSVGEQLLRMADAQYGDGVSSLAGEFRPSAREISNELAQQDADAAGNERGLSAFVYLWGQFIDHDIDVTLAQDAEGESAAIEVPTDDPYFDPDGTGTMTIGFTRSAYDSATGDSATNPRQQTSSITAWIDGSGVYGSDQATADSLRSFVGGRMRIGDDGLPPVEDGFFVAGDIRANENAELTAMHALFLREHNNWADRIAAADPSLSDEQIFQQARAIVIAEIQAITFNEYLPALLGRSAIAPYAGYDSSVDPTIANEFSTAAFRFGHSQVNEEIEFFGNDGRPERDEVELSEAFFNPALLMETGIDGLMKYVASSQSMEVDLAVVDSLRNFLFGPPGAGGLDLASLNIQRGRDHGLADYNSVREAYGLPRVTSFDEITSDSELAAKLEQLYVDVNDVDLWVGCLAEDHVAGASVGELARTIIVDQFTRLRDGDRLWYQNVFAGRDLAAIESTSLADIVERNTGVRGLQDNVFFMNAVVGGQVTQTAPSARGRQRTTPAANATVELLNDEGVVIDTTVTDRQGRYQFATFRETGDYQIRVTTTNPAGNAAGATIDVHLSRGGIRRNDANIALGRPDVARQRPAPRPPARDHLAAVDEAFAADAMAPLRRITGLDDPGPGRRRRR
ncbi:MAG: hypothetical protein KDA44_10030 [Planctomycetales bacterium]|nr:hypothetical protein [Planctomycetales bacterium]